MGEFDVAPVNIMPGVQALTSSISQGRKEQAQADLQTRAGEILQSGDPAQISQFMIENPSLANTMQVSMEANRSMKKGESLDLIGQIVGGADPVRALGERAQLISQRGGNPQDTLQLIETFKTNPEQGMQEIERQYSFLDPQGYQSFIKSQGRGGGETKVGAQEILEDGTIIQSTPSGPVVFSPSGEKLTGTAAATAIQTARAEKVNNLRLASGGKREASLEADLKLKAMVEAGIVSAKDAASASTKAFEKVEKIHSNIANLYEVNRLIDEGAETGAIAKMLPNFRKSSIMLNNLQAGLGLDIIGNTTFGALSEKELSFALDTALPVGLEGPALKEWSTRKIAAQEMLADYVESAAMYLGTPGNTAKGWVEYQRNRAGDQYGIKQQPLPEGVTEEDIAETMRANNMSRAQVMARLGGK